MYIHAYTCTCAIYLCGVDEEILSESHRDDVLLLALLREHAALPVPAHHTTAACRLHGGGAHSHPPQHTAPHYCQPL